MYVIKDNLGMVLFLNIHHNTFNDVRIKIKLLSNLIVMPIPGNAPAFAPEKRTKDTKKTHIFLFSIGIVLPLLLSSKTADFLDTLNSEKAHKTSYPLVLYE